MLSNHLIVCHPLLLLPSIFPSIRVFSNESALRIRWPKYWSFSFNISPSNEHPGLISFRMDCLDLLAVIPWVKFLFTPCNNSMKLILLLFYVTNECGLGSEVTGSNHKSGRGRLNPRCPRLVATVHSCMWFTLWWCSRFTDTSKSLSDQGLLVTRKHEFRSGLCFLIQAWTTIPQHDILFLCAKK